MLSESEEEYLEQMYAFIEDVKDPTVRGISEAMNVSNASVSEMIKRLSEKGLVRHNKYGPIELTSSGLVAARNMKRKHRLLESLLRRLGVKDVHDEACRLEHGISEESTDALCRFLKAPDKCPDDGKEIPKCGKDCSVCLRILLSDAPQGKDVTISELQCGKKAAMRLNELGLVPKEKIRVINRLPHGPIEVEVKGTKVAIGNGLAMKIVVEECE